MGTVCRESIGLPTTTTTITNKNNKNKNHARITRLTRFSHLLILIALGVVALVVAPVTTTAAIVGLTVAFAPPPPPPLVKQHDTPSNNGICNHDDGLRTRRNRARAPLGWNRRRSGVFALKASSASLAANNANSSTNSNTDTTTASNNNNNNNKRNILILSHNVSPLVADGLFNPNNLLTHRIDVLARCINSALWVSNGIRTDTTVYVMLFPHNVTIEVRGEEVRDLNPDERSVALLLQRSLLADYYDGSDVGVDIVSDSGDTNQRQQIIQTQQNQNQQKQRREAEINRLRQKQRTRPKTINPHKPGSLSKSEKRAFRIDRKAREAMVRRIIRHDCLRDDDDDDDDATTTGERRSASGRQPPPRGFTVHRDDTLVARLEDLKLKSGHGHDGSSNGGGSQVLMLNEMGDPLGSVLGELSHNNYLMTSNTNNKKEGYESTMPIATPVASMSTQTTPLATTSPASAIESTTSSYKLPQATTTTIILGDQIGYAPCDEKILAESVHAVRQVSLGPLSLLTSQCITIVHHYLDTYEALPL